MRVACKATHRFDLSAAKTISSHNLNRANLLLGPTMITKHKDDAVAYKWIAGHTVSQERSKRRGANRAGKVACHSFANGIFR